MPHAEKLLCAAALLGLFFLAACTQAAVETEAVKLYKAYLEADSNITTMQAELEAQSGGVTMRGVLLMKENKIREEIEYQTAGKTVSMRIYVLEAGVWTCPNVAGEWKCSKTQTVTSIDRRTNADRLMQMLKKNALLFDADVTEKTVSGYACGQVKASANIGALTQEEKYFLLAVGGVGAVPNPETYAAGLQSFEMVSCITADMVSIYDETTLKIALAEPIRITRTLKNYSTNQPISDDVFIVPQS